MTTTTPEKSDRRGGRRMRSAEIRAAQVRHLRGILDLGYNHSIAARRAGVAVPTARKWAQELGIKFNY